MMSMKPVISHDGEHETDKTDDGIGHEIVHGGHEPETRCDVGDDNNPVDRMYMNGNMMLIGMAEDDYISVHPKMNNSTVSAMHKSIYSGLKTQAMIKTPPKQMML